MRKTFIVLTLFASLKLCGADWNTLERIGQKTPFLGKIDTKAEDAPVKIREKAILCFEIGFQTKDPSWIEKALFYINRFFESVEHATIPDDWKVAARIYSNAGILSQDPKLSLIYGRQAANFWEQYFQESKPEAIENMDYANCAVAHNNLGIDAKDFEEKENSFAQAAKYWDQYLLQSKDLSTALRERASAYNNAAFWTMSLENRPIFAKRAASFWSLFLKQATRETPEDIANIINAYQEVIRYEKPQKQQYYRSEIIRLSSEYGISNVYQLGNDIFFFSEKERKAIEKQGPLTLTLSKEESADIDDYNPALLATSAEEHSEHIKDFVTNASISAKVEENQGIPTKGKKESDLDNPSSIMSPATIPPSMLTEEKELEETLSNIHLQQKKAPVVDDQKAPATAAKLTKTEKKLSRPKGMMLEPQGIKATRAPTREHSVDRLTVHQIQKAYTTQESQEEAISILDEIITLQSGVHERMVLAHLSKLKKYFSVQKNDSSQETVILGHNISEFFFHKAHGSRQGDWDAGMIQRLKRFVRDIKTTFEAIILQSNRKA